MRSTEELLEDLSSRQVKLWIDGDKLRANAPSAVLTASLRSELADHKPRILQILRGEDSSSAQVALVPTPREEFTPLSCAQERLWSLAELRPGSCVYNSSTALRLEGPLDTAALEESLRQLQRRHEILRTGIRLRDGKPFQEISPEASIELPLTDLSTFEHQRQEFQVGEVLESEIKQPFDLAVAPLWRCRLLRLGPEHHVLSVVTHHIVFDGFSQRVLLAELGQHYRRCTTGRDLAELPDLPLQYADFALHQRGWLEGEDAARQLDYWRGQLAGSLSELQLPTDHPRPAAPPFRGSSQPFVLSDALAERLASVSRQEQVSLYISLLAGFQALLHRYSGQEDLVVCSPAACRDDQRLEALIGYFNNVVALRTNLGDNPTLRELLTRVREVVLGASAHQNLPFQNVSALSDLVRTPLTRGLFSFRNVSGQDFASDGLEVSEIDVRKQEADFDIALYMEEREGRLNGVLEYNADLFDPASIERLVRNFEVVLLALADTPDARLDQLPRFGREPGEVEALLRGYPKIDDACVVDRVAYLVLNEHEVPSLEEVREYLQTELPDYRVPRSLVTLDLIPLRSDGSVDVAALPPTALAAPRSSSTPPRTPLETQIAEIWKRVLWLDAEVGIHDDFVDLGGHSLLSVQLVGEIEELLGRRVPVHALAKLGTIAGFVEALEREPSPDVSSPNLESREPGRLPADIYYGLHAYVATWEGKRASDESLLVGLHTEGRQQALYWCLQRHGELAQLAKYLGPDQPVYGMRSGNKVMEKTQENASLLAEHYIGEILSLQPEGPYLIGGNCQAGQIAFQVAKRLLERGHEVTLLFLLDRFVAEPYPGRVAIFFGADSNRNAKLYYRQPERGWRKYYSGVIVSGEVRGAHSQFFREPNVQALAHTIRTAIEGAQKAEPETFERGGLQLLGDSAYSARLSAPKRLSVVAGERVVIAVEVENTSDTTWRESEFSGVELGNRWHEKKRKRRRSKQKPRQRGQLAKEDRGVPAVDARALLPRDVEPGSSVRLDLSVTAPATPGAYVLELDLVEEGVTWFKQMGSKPLRVEARVRRRSKFRDRLSDHMRGWTQQGPSPS